MHKIHIVQRPDGTLLVVGVLNPGMPYHYAENAEAALKRNFKDTNAIVVVVSYATQVEVANQSLAASLKSWWLARKLKARFA